MKYWGEEQEEAIVEFNVNENIEDKHKVFVSVIEPAFRKLVENIYILTTSTKYFGIENRLNMKL